MIKGLDALKKESKVLDIDNKKRIDLTNKLKMEEIEERNNLIERFFNTYKEKILTIIEKNIITALYRHQGCIIDPEVIFKNLYFTDENSIRENFMEMVNDIELSSKGRSFNLELYSKHLCELIANEIKGEYKYIYIDNLYNDKVKLKILTSKSKIVYVFSYIKIWWKKYDYNALLVTKGE